MQYFKIDDSEYIIYSIEAGENNNSINYLEDFDGINTTSISTEEIESEEVLFVYQLRPTSLRLLGLKIFNLAQVLL